MWRNISRESLSASSEAERRVAAFAAPPPSVRIATPRSTTTKATTSRRPARHLAICSTILRPFLPPADVRHPNTERKPCTRRSSVGGNGRSGEIFQVPLTGALETDKMEKLPSRPACLWGERRKRGGAKREGSQPSLSRAIICRPSEERASDRLSHHLLLSLLYHAYALEDLGYTPEISHRSGMRPTTGLQGL